MLVGKILEIIETSGTRLNAFITEYKIPSIVRNVVSHTVFATEH